jgi:hypothetical protein
MSENHRSETEAIIDVSRIILVPYICAFPSLDYEGFIITPIPKIRVHPAGDHPAGAIEEFL